MQLDILAVGRMKSGPEQDLLARYLDRAEKAGRQLGLSGPTVKEFAESREASVDARKAEEAKIMLETAKGAIIIALDEHGKHQTSTEFADMIRKCADNGEKQLSFAIGGPDGHGAQLLDAARHTIALGKLTWPHQIARVLLAEQIYRATTIMTGHPYHRA